MNNDLRQWIKLQNIMLPFNHGKVLIKEEGRQESTHPVRAREISANSLVANDPDRFHHHVVTCFQDKHGCVNPGFKVL
jgi:hypothetical protein